jgi:CheY-like chemotaxis protein
MGGEIQVESEPGVGSHFWFSLPSRQVAAGESTAAEQNAPAREAPVAEADAKVDRPLQGHILLVEDNRINQMVATRMLDKLGLTYDIANHGGESLQKLEQRDYDLILMDMEMPEMDGMEASVQIRARENATGKARIPIIAMTANALNEDRDRCLSSGMDDHMAKPVEMARLNALLRHWLPVH